MEVKMLEIIAQTPEDAIAAQAGGATQIDLKANFLQDGVTPSVGMVECVCGEVNIDVIVMIRSRGNGMVLNSNDMKVMCRDIDILRKAGAAGFLLGALTEKREIDVDAVRTFQDVAKDKPIHFHLAWELTTNLEATLEKLIEIGVKSARTSGGQGLGGKVEDAIEYVKKFKEISSGRIDLLLAGGVSKENIADLVFKTGVMNAHAGSSVRIPPNPKGYVIEEKVRDLRNAFDLGVKKYEEV